VLWNGTYAWSPNGRRWGPRGSPMSSARSPALRSRSTPASKRSTADRPRSSAAAASWDAKGRLSAALSRSSARRSLFCASIALVGGSQKGLDGILPVVEHRLARGRQVVPIICGTVPCVGVPLPTVKSNLAVFGGYFTGVLLHPRVHHPPPGSGEEVGSCPVLRLDSTYRQVKVRQGPGRMLPDPERSTTRAYTLYARRRGGAVRDRRTAPCAAPPPQVGTTSGRAGAAAQAYSRRRAAGAGQTQAAPGCHRTPAGGRRRRCAATGSPAVTSWLRRPWPSWERRRTVVAPSAPDPGDRKWAFRGTFRAAT
jgi:hypothetical protein